MDVLIACEESGIVRDAFIAKGHNAISCDLKETRSPGPHYTGSVIDAFDWSTGGYFDFLEHRSFDLIIAHPPCTYICSSGLHWNKRVPGRAEKTTEALQFVRWLWERDCGAIVIENPVGCINTRLPFMPKPQYIQPYQFGDNASKKTGLWMRGVKPLIPTRRIKGRFVNHNGKLVERWDNQTDSGQNRLPPSKGRAAARSETYKGIANAMADQWG